MKTVDADNALSVVLQLDRDLRRLADSWERSSELLIMSQDSYMHEKGKSYASCAHDLRALLDKVGR